MHPFEALSIDQVLKIVREKYVGPKIAFLTLGGGYSCLDFRKMTGSSKFYYGSIDLYDQNFVVGFITKYSKNRTFDLNQSIVSEETTMQLIESMILFYDNRDLLYVVVNSALTTDRYRKGENKAFVAIYNNKSSEHQIYKISLNKDSEKDHSLYKDYLDIHRSIEDRKVGQSVLSLIMDDYKLAPELEQGETIERCRSTGK